MGVGKTLQARATRTKFVFVFFVSREKQSDKRRSNMALASGISRLSLSKEWNIRVLRLMSTLNQNSASGPSGIRQDVGSQQKCSIISPPNVRPIQSGSPFTLYSNLGSRPGSNSITREFSTTNKNEGSGNGAGSGSGQGKGRGSYGRYRDQGIGLLILGVVCFALKPVLPHDLRQVLDAVGYIGVVLGLVLIVVSFL